MPEPGGGRHDHSLRAPCARSGGQILRGPARAGEIAECDPQLDEDVRVSQVEHREVIDPDLPEPPPLRARIDRAARRRPPLGPGGGRLERRVERPRLAAAVVAPIGRRRTVRWQCRRVEAGLAMSPTAEPAERAQT